jgi:hypothetical protein
MADDVNEAIEAALITISSSVEMSGNMKKELKHKLYETVSILRTLFVRLIDINESKNKQISELELLENNTKAEQEWSASSSSTEGHGPPPINPRRELARTGYRQVATPRMEQRKLYSQALGEMQTEKAHPHGHFQRSSTTGRNKRPTKVQNNSHGHKDRNQHPQNI